MHSWRNVFHASEGKFHLEMLVLLAIMAGNILLGGPGNGDGHSREIAFPFFSWNLFSDISSTRHEFTLLLPEREYDNILVYVPDRDRYFVHSIVQRLGEAYQRSDTEDEKMLLDRLETDFLPPHTRSLSLVLITGDPLIEYLHGSKYVQPITSFAL